MRFLSFYLVTVMLGVFCIHPASANETNPPSSEYVDNFTPEEPVPEVRILSLNNSLLNFNRQDRMFENIAASKGHLAKWTLHTNNGQSLQYHWEEGEDLTVDGLPSAKALVRTGDWTHIILQEFSNLPLTDFDQFRTNVANWVGYIRECCPNPDVTIILPMNWAYFTFDSDTFKSDTETIHENYTKLANEFSLTVCPVGLAYARKYERDGAQAILQSWYLRDVIHPTIAASYMAALMEYGMIFEEDPLDVEYYPEGHSNVQNFPLEPELAQDSREYAHEILYSSLTVMENLSADKGLVVGRDRISSPEAGGIALYSLEGRCVANVCGNSLDISDVPGGFYVVTATLASKTVSKKIFLR